MVGCSLYRFYDAKGILLYVGVTSVGPSRWVEHEQNRAWWDQVVRTAVQHFPTRPDALQAEKTAIQIEHPVYNTVHRQMRPTPRTPTKRRHGAGTVIERPDGRWAFVGRVNGRQRWINTHSEAEAELLRFCHEFRGLPRATRDKAIAILGEMP